MRKFSPNWQYSATHTLWRLMFSDTGLILGEDRDTNNKTVMFFCLDASSGTVLWEKMEFAERWWIGLEGVSGERIFFHGFKKPDMPEHQSIICADIHTGKELWRNNDCAFLATDAHYVYGYRDLFERRMYYKLDIDSGTFLEEHSELPEYINSLPSAEKSDFDFPQPYGEENIPLLSSFVDVHSDTVRSVEYIETDKFVIFNTHHVKQSVQHNVQESLTNTLYIIERESGTKKYHEILNHDTPFPVPDSFFLDKTILYFIKEKKYLIALNLDQ